MNKKLLYSPEALQDLDDIGEYISEELSSPKAANKILTEICSTIDLLSNNPRIILDVRTHAAHILVP